MARAVSGRLGRESALVRALRPVYDWTLHALTLGRGVPILLNGREPLRIDPRYRSHFPERYDPEVLAFLREATRPGDIVLDVGANIGIYALCLARWTGPSGRVYAFEPSPAARRVLERHVRLNGMEETLEVLGSAVSDRTGQAPFFAVGIEGYSRLDRPNPGVTQAEAISVPVTTLDAFCRERGLSPNGIVVDVEGHEAAVLRGARRLLEAGGGRVRLVVEMHPMLWPSLSTSREEMQQVLDDLRLVPKALRGQRDPVGESGIVALEAQ